MPVTTPEGYRFQPVLVVEAGAHYPESLLAHSRNLLEATRAMIGSFGPLAALVRRVTAKFPIHAARATVAAARLGVQPEDVLAANLCYDVLLGSTAMGCSTAVLPGPNGPVLSRNMDWFPADRIAKASCLIREDFGVNAGFIGLLGAVTGLSSHGFGICLNAAFAGTNPEGFPVLLFIRHVLDTARSYSEAVAIAEREPLMTGCIITVVGQTTYERAIIERTPTRAKVRMAAGDEPLLATNHFRALASPENCPRYDYLSRNVTRLPVMEVLMSHQVLQEITAQHVVLCPRTGTAEMFVPSHLLVAEYQNTVTPSDLFRLLG